MRGIDKRLRSLREEMNLSMREAAKLIGVPESTYRDWEYGREIRGEPYLQIAKAFGVSLDELFGENIFQLDIEQRLIRIKCDADFILSNLKERK